MNIKEYRVIHESDFSRLVTDTYGRPYSYQQQNFDSQDTFRPFSVPYDFWFESEEADRAAFEAWRDAEPPAEGDFNGQLFWHREFFPPFGALLDDMVERGLIEPGDNYALHIWW